MKEVWLITQGLYYTNGYPLCVCRTREIVIDLCRKDGFKYTKEDDIWTDGDKWRRAERIAYLDGR